MAKTFSEKRPGCQTCPMVKRPFVPPQTKKHAAIMLVVDAPREDEAERRQPLVGEASHMLDEMLLAGDFQRKDMYITCGVKCQPRPDPHKRGKYRPIPTEAIHKCRELFLIPEIKKLKPKLIMPMGDLAMQAVTKRRGIMKHRGFVTQQTLKQNDQHVTVKLLPTFDARHMMQAPQLKQFSVADFQEAVVQQDTRKVVTNTYTGDYKALTSKRETLRFLKSFNHVTDGSVDIETTDLGPNADILCVQLSPQPGLSRVLNFYGEYPTKIPWAFSKNILRALFRVLNNRRIMWYGSNIKFDFRGINRLFHAHLGKTLPVSKMRWRELLLMQLLKDENIPKDLKTLAHAYTPVRYSKAALDEVREGRITKISVEDRTFYACQDTDAGIRVGRFLTKWFKLKENRRLWKLFRTHEMPLAKALWDMEVFGCHIDRLEGRKLRNRVGKKLKKIEQRMYKMVGRKFGIKSNKDLPKILFRTLKIKPNKKFKNQNGYSTSREHIDWLIANQPHPFLDLLRQHREFSVLFNTTLGQEGVFKKTGLPKGILGALDEQDLVHTNFKPQGMVTGRVGSDSPNILNIPRDRTFWDGSLISVRRIFTARPGHILIVLDYSQIEVKLIALMANVKRILRKLKQGEDFHVITARDMFGQRFAKAEAIMKSGQWHNKTYSKKQIQKYTQLYDEMRQDSKTFNFAMVYQAGDETLAAQMKKPVDQVADFRVAFFERYPQIKRMIDACGEAAVRDGFIEYPNGRKRRFAKMYHEWQQAKQKRQAFNSLPQGMGGYIGRYALLRICRAFRKHKIHGFPNNIVYDSIAAEVKVSDAVRAAKIMAREALRPVKELDNFIFSIKIGSGLTWQQAEQTGLKMKAMNEFGPVRAQLKKVAAAL